MDNEQNQTESFGHEPIETDVRAVTWSVVALWAAIAAALVIVAGLFAFFVGTHSGRLPHNIERAERSQAPPATNTSLGVPPLDPHQADDLVALRERARKRLGEYAWVDQEAGIARIPIERAMSILSQRGAGATPKSQEGGNHD